MFQRLKNGGWPYSQPPNVPFEINEDSEQAEGLIAWYPTLGSRGANVLHDFGGRGLDGAFPGGAANPAWAVDGQFGSVLDFDGNDDYVDCGSGSSFEFGTTADFSVGVWVKTVTSFGVIVHYGDIDNVGEAKGWSIFVSAAGKAVGFIKSALGVEASVTGTTDVTDDASHHVFATYNRDGNLTLYVDGVQEGTPADISGIGDVTATNGVKIGARYDNGVIEVYFNGTIADVRIHNVVLSPSTIWGMAHDKKWELYRPVRRYWAVRPTPLSALLKLHQQYAYTGGCIQ